ncbi:MAG: DUF2845 domain-containing protein [Pseudomonadales bacterium]|jgi:major membrane immunogen (membrane-anchored lipoprotein)
MKFGVGVLALSLLLLAGSASAESFKCRNKFISTGDRKAIVLLRCGEPLFAEVVSGDDEVKVEEWTYKSRGYKGFLRILTFRGGRLVDISVGEKVQ